MAHINSEFSNKDESVPSAPKPTLLAKAKGFFRKHLLMIVLVIALAFVASSLALALKSHALLQQLKAHKGTILALGKDSSTIKSSLENAQKELARVARDLEAANGDRERLNVQVKNLLAEKDKARETESAYEKLKLDKEVVEKDRELLLKENQDFGKQIEAQRSRGNDLETVKQQLIKEKEQLQQVLELERQKTGIKKFEEERLAVKKENTSLASDLKRAESQIKMLQGSEEKLRDEAKRLTEKSDKLSEAYSQVLKTNKAYEGGILDAPSKVGELARQNKVLIRQTARMHYNLGVFYSKKKEYSRAAGEFAKTVELTPDDAYAYFNLGYIYAENLVNRPKAIEYFRQYLQYARKDDKDADWVKKYILTWETWQGKKQVQ